MIPFCWESSPIIWIRCTKYMVSLARTPSIVNPPLITTGPIVRINPWEVHIKDPEFFDTIYNMTAKLDKDPWYYNFAGIPNSAFATQHTHLHRLRRAATSKLFSMSYALRMQPVVHSCVEKLLAKLEGNPDSKPGQPFNLSHQYWCMASEVVSSCMMPHSSNYLSDDDAPNFGKMFKTLAVVALWNRHFPWFFMIMSAIPHWIVKRTSGTFVDVLKLFDVSVQSLPRG